MSSGLISRNADLSRLWDGGFDIEIKAGHLLLKGVPYLNARRKLAFGVLVSVLEMATDLETAKPEQHVVHFVGEHPCNTDGSEIQAVKNSSKRKKLAEDLEVDHTFSQKPQGGYEDYYQKMMTYMGIISAPAYALFPNLKRSTPLAPEPPEDDDSVFAYIDTASSRAGINVVADKLAIASLAIVGLGGTGAYILDQVAKTRVREIHLFDGDYFLLHNAFRSPGAAGISDLKAKPTKVDYYHSIYSKMHRGIRPHGEYIDSSNVEMLLAMQFVFICVDKAEPRKLIVEKLSDSDVPFIDVGMGVQLVDDKLLGIVRTTTSTPEHRKHAGMKIPLADSGAENEYSENIQIGDLNALNAALAVIKWKKLFGFYLDLDREHTSNYTIDGNHLSNEDKDDAPDEPAA